MNTLTIQKWEGLISAAWALLGLRAFISYQSHQGFDSIYGAFFLVFLLWWGIALLLALSGFKSRSLVGICASLSTSLGFLWFTTVLLFRL